MAAKPRMDIMMNLPALEKLENMLLVRCQTVLQFLLSSQFSRENSNISIYIARQWSFNELDK